MAVAALTLLQNCSIYICVCNNTASGAYQRVIFEEKVLWLQVTMCNI